MFGFVVAANGVFGSSAGKAPSVAAMDVVVVGLMVVQAPVLRC